MLFINAARFSSLYSHHTEMNRWPQVNDSATFIHGWLVGNTTNTCLLMFISLLHNNHSNPLSHVNDLKMVSCEDNSALFPLIPTIRVVTFIEYVVHWLWVRNCLRRKKYIYTKNVYLVILSGETPEDTQTRQQTLLLKVYRFLLFIHFYNATTFECGTTSAFELSYIPLLMTQNTGEAELNCISICIFCFLKRSARVRCKDSWPKKTPFKCGDDNSFWGKPAINEILKLCTWKIAKAVLTLRVYSNWHCGCFVWHHFIT